jgi:glutamate synthase domain-containing protein 3
MNDETAAPPARADLVIDCRDLTTRLINQQIRAAIACGHRRIELLHPTARHNLGVALPAGVELSINGSAGYYVGGLNNGASLYIKGSVGWGAGESMNDGTILIDGNAGNAAAASIRAGTVVIKGNASTRAGIAMKGGLLIIGGRVGPMAGFMMQKGVMIVCGDAGPGVADSMYAGTIFLGGEAAELGADAVFEDLTPADQELIDSSLEKFHLDHRPHRFRKLIAGRRLWNFQEANRELWKSAL